MLPSRGRPGQVLLFEVERELTSEDIFRLGTDSTIGRSAPPILKTLKDNHHAIARYIASGRTVSETAELCGLTPQRVGDLVRTDPAFGNLLAFYRDQVAVSGIDEAKEFRGTLRNIARGALEEIKTRLTDPEAISKMEIDSLRRLSEMALDRTDAPPRTAQNVPNAPVEITFNMGPRKIEPKVIDQTPAPTLELEDPDIRDREGTRP